MTDDDIVRSIRAGGSAAPRALRYLVEERGWWQWVKRQLVTQGLPPPDAEEHTSDCFVTLYRKIRAGDYDHQGKLKSYLGGIARNRSRQYHRRRQPELTGLGEEVQRDLRSVEATPLELQEGKDFADRVDRLLKHCGEGCLEIMKLKLRGFSNEEIAGKIGFAGADSVKSKVHRCRKQLGKLMKESGWD